MFIAANSKSFIVFPAVVYMLALITGLSREESIQTATVLLPPVMIIFGGVVPYLIIRTTVHGAFAEIPGEPSGARLTRILKIPRKLELGIESQTAAAIAVYTGLPALYFHKSLWTVPWGTLVVSLLISLMMIQQRLDWERILRPHAIAEFHRDPEATPKGAGIFWVRQRWYLPYVLGLFVASTLTTAMTVVMREAYDGYQHLREQAQNQATTAQFVAMLDETAQKLAKDALVPISILGAYMLLTAAVSAWQLSRYQTEGAQSVQDAVQALAGGHPKLPQWVASDEVGDLAAATASGFERLKAFSNSLGDSAHALWRSAEQLGQSANKQAEALTHQASALQETQVTTQEIKQTSALTAQKAENILQQVEKADEISRAGELAIQQSLDGLLGVGEIVKEMAQLIRNLDMRTRQIVNITSTVKGLADQSNMLALNAAIEAVRSGEHGKGFGVVAREIRNLADQSVRATNNVRNILDDISSAITNVAIISERGSEKVENSLVQIRAFESNIRQLSGIVRDNAASVRQITVAVNQQNTGIAQIFQAVNDLSRLMEQTMEQLRSSDEALTFVRGVTDKVATMAGQRTSAPTSASANGSSLQARAAQTLAVLSDVSAHES
ncbi:hypothetical protein DAT35_16240 [Vitiosangium sp. GDMCC 1.1324]|nr:hypothetical protein DAT35_16240 [Vitiosangium sp. GDMCC 1.1324]